MFQNIGQLVMYPTPLPFDANAFAISNYTLSTSGNKLACVFQAPASGYLDKVLIYPGAVTLNAASKLRVSFQSVNVSGTPTMVQDQWNDGNPSANTIYLTGSIKAANNSQRAVQMGDWVAAVFEFGNFNASDSIALPRGNINGYSRLTGEEHLCDYTLATNTWSKNFQMPACSIQYTDGNFYPLLQGGITGPASTAVVTQTFNSGSNPNEIGLLFTVPFATQICGAAFFGSVAANGSFIWSLYDNNTNLLTSYTYSALRDVDNTTKTYKGSRFSQIINLVPNTQYRLTIKPQNANNVSFIYSSFSNSQYQQAAIPFLSTWQWTQRNNAGVWSQSNVTPLIYLLLSGLPTSSLINTMSLNGGLQ